MTSSGTCCTQKSWSRIHVRPASMLARVLETRMMSSNADPLQLLQQLSSQLKGLPLRLQQH